MAKRTIPAKKQFDLSIVIPAYREEKRIGSTLNALARYIKDNRTLSNLQVEVIVVAADAPDKTHEIVLAKTRRFKSLELLKPGKKAGKGRDVQYGMLHAGGKAVLFMDADLATPLYHIERFYQAYLAGRDVVVATRNLKKHHKGVVRRSISNLGNLLFRLFGGVWVEDSQCGFKLFSDKATEICFSRMTIQKWGFDMEILAIAKANGFEIKTYRVDDWISVPEGTFAENVLQSSLESLRDLFIIFTNRLKGVYKVNLDR